MVFCFQSKAQSNVFLIGSSSLDLSSDSISLAISIGEPILSTLRHHNHCVSQGFLQADPKDYNGIFAQVIGTETAIYPNPFDQQIQVSSTIDFKSYCLYDAYGKLIDSNAYSPVLNLEHLNPSTYLLVLYSENKQIIRKFKILKLY